MLEGESAWRRKRFVALEDKAGRERKLAPVFRVADSQLTMHGRISINPKVCHGQACIKGTRIPVHQIFRMLANGDSVESLLRAYPSVHREDILACFDYAASLAEEEVTPLESFRQE